MRISLSCKPLRPTDALPFIPLCFSAQSSRGEIFDGTCNGANGRRGQSIEEIMATLTVTVVVVEISAARPGLSRVRRYR